MGEPRTVEIGGVRVPPGERRRIEIPVARLFTQQMLALPVTVVAGTREGPRLWLDAAIHGDELNGAEIIRQVLAKLDPARLRGAVVAVPIVNVVGFIHQSRYLPDRRDLNRSFPGSRRGSLASRLAHLFLTEVVERCTHGIDLHSGSHHRTNLPQVRANLDDAETARIARAFGAPLTIHARTIRGSLRETAARRKIPMFVYEAGEPLRFNADAIRTGVAGVLRVMAALKMVRGVRAAGKRSVEIRATTWVRARRSGILHMQIALGHSVKEGQPLCHVADAFGDALYPVPSPCAGIVVGRTNNPLVHRGDALVHLALTDPGAKRRRDDVEEVAEAGEPL